MWDSSRPSVLRKWDTRSFASTTTKQGEDAARRWRADLREASARASGQACRRGVDFTTDLGTAVEQSEAIFIAVGTPQGDTGAADLSYVEAVVSEIARSVTATR